MIDDMRRIQTISSSSLIPRFLHWIAPKVAEIA